MAARKKGIQAKLNEQVRARRALVSLASKRLYGRERIQRPKDTSRLLKLIEINQCGPQKVITALRNLRVLMPKLSVEYRHRVNQHGWTVFVIELQGQPDQVDRGRHYLDGAFPPGRQTPNQLRLDALFNAAHRAAPGRARMY